MFAGSGHQMSTSVRMLLPSSTTEKRRPTCQDRPHPSPTSESCCWRASPSDRDGIRNAAYGLTDEQARQTPTAGALSVGGLVTHVTAMERSWIDMVLQGGPAAAPREYEEGFRLGPDRTLAEAIADSTRWRPRPSRSSGAVARPPGARAQGRAVVPGRRRGLVAALGAAAPDRGDRSSRRARRHRAGVDRRRHDVRADGRRGGLAGNGLVAAVDAPDRGRRALVIARDGYPAGVPCWIDTGSPTGGGDEFYGGVFGWTFDERHARPGSADRDVVAALDGLTVAGVGHRRAADGHGPRRAGTRTSPSTTPTTSAATVWKDRRTVLPPPPTSALPGAGDRRRPGRGGAAAVAGRHHRGAQVVNADDSVELEQPRHADPAAVGAFYCAVFGWELTAVDIGGAEAIMVRRPGYGDHLAELEPGIRERQDESGAPPASPTRWRGWSRPPTGEPARGRSCSPSATPTPPCARAVELGGDGARRAVRRRPRSHRRAGRPSGRRVHGEPLDPRAFPEWGRRARFGTRRSRSATGPREGAQPTWW